MYHLLKVFYRLLVSNELLSKYLHRSVLVETKRNKIEYFAIFGDDNNLVIKVIKENFRRNNDAIIN